MLRIMVLRLNCRGYAVDISKTESSVIEEGKETKQKYIFNLEIRIKGSYL